MHVCNIFPRHWPVGFPILDVHNKCSGILAMKLRRQKVKHSRLVAKSLKSDLCKKSWEFTLDTHHEFLKTYIVCTVNKLSGWDYTLCLFLDLPSAFQVVHAKGLWHGLSLFLGVLVHSMCRIEMIETMEVDCSHLLFTTIMRARRSN